MTLTNIQPVTRLVLSAGIIFGVLATVVAASSALLQTNEATATDNDFSVASSDILEIAADIANGPGPYATTLPNAFNAAGMVPGDAREFKFWLRNTTSDDIELHLFADLAGYTFTHDGAPISSTVTELDANMKVQFLCDVIGSSNDGNTIEQTLTSWTSSATTGKQQFNESSTVILEASPTGRNQAQCTMRVTLDSESEDEGDSVQFDAIFSGEQIGPSPTPTPTG